MKTIDLNRPATVIALALLLATPLAVVAQSVGERAKGTPQAPPRPSESRSIPSGIDAGTPATSNAAQLGTPTTPANEAEREQLKRASAAARAAARPRARPASAPASGATAASGVSAAARRASGSASGWSP